MTAQTPNNLFDTSSEAQARRARLRHGDRSKLAKMAVIDLCAVWDEQGISAVRRMAFHDPSGFVKVVAGLMPQKLEITHPTDGLSDERLAVLLELAQHMAALKAGTADEKRLIDVTPERGVGGPDRVGDVPREGCPSSDRAAENPVSTDPSNRLDNEVSLEDSTAERLIAEESDYAIQPPVGRPCTVSTEAEKRDNLRKLNDEDDIDPASLF